MNISIITINLNNKLGLNNTITSVISQDSIPFEFIIIDGVSTDGSVELINDVEDNYNFVKFIIEHDQGVYDAMNKGILKANGDYILFLNSGDVFFNNKTICAIKRIVESPCDILIGKHSVGNKISKNKPLKEIWKGNFCSHQSTIYSAKFLKAFRYDLNFKFAADFKLLFNGYMMGYKLVIVDRIFSTIAPGGLSDRNRVKVYLEYMKVIKESEQLTLNRSIYFLVHIVINHIKILIKRS